VKYGDSAQADTIRKMVVAMSRDIRVLVIKLADRLHNMRTLRYLRQDKQERIARETIDIFAPLAHRLGMNTIKWELEDLSFATLHPKVYDEVVRLVADRAPSREQFMEKVVSDVEADLRQAKIKAKVTGRPKHYYSIYQKMLLRGREFADIYDLVGIRILVENEAECYGVLGILHARWNPIPGRFKDYISVPKFNMYQSLHTTVIGPQGKSVEMQIRSFAMHRRAEYGVAAHWKYKEDVVTNSKATKTKTKTAVDEPELMWLRELLDWQSETEDPGDFLDSLRFEMHSAAVYAYTPRGDLVQLPTGATPVDFAYSVHTEVGHSCIGARVNGRLVPLESKLESGDVVEIFTSKSPTAAPSLDWLEFVASPRARNKIRQWFTKERREEAADHGKDLIAKQMRKEGLPLHRLFNHETLNAVASDLHLADVTALYAAVGEGNVGPQNVVDRVLALAGGREGAIEDLAEATQMPTRGNSRRKSLHGDAGVIVEGLSGDVLVKLARCCTPVPGDAIVGFVTRMSGVSVHRDDCTNLKTLLEQPERLTKVQWAPTAKSMFLVAIQVEALDRPRLLSDVTRVISDQHVNILSASLSTGRDRVAKSKFTFEMADPKHLGHVLSAVRTVEGVFDVYRLTQ
ncbi:MAG: pyrophosphokinae, partial [Nocardioidaceae bacterium]|nr:pyrophosphokinae [Nocardioidaceae bacterium]